MNCRFCATPLQDVFLDLGSAPPSNAYLSQADLSAPEIWFPLRLYTCSDCHLVQVDEIERHDKLFASDYAYFSSYSASWLKHAERYVEEVVERLHLGADSLVMELASNDGYLLQYVKARAIPCVGIEPTAGTAAAARTRGIDTVEQFFSQTFAQQFVTDRRQADLIVANNVLAHVPDLNDFVAGINTALAPEGVATLEFPHLLQLVEQHQFDTVYHEHFSYFAFHTAQRIFAAHGMRLFDAQELPTHGGSLRLWVCKDNAEHPTSAAIDAMLDKEQAAGMFDMDFYRHFQAIADTIKNTFLEFLLQCRRDGKSVAAYGAAAKGNTLLNYAGVRADLLSYVVDASPHKQGRFLPGSHIPIVHEDTLRETKPDYIMILPWNLKQEIAAQLNYIHSWGAALFIAVPSLCRQST